MTKSLMIPVRPQHAVNILNGKKTLDLRTWIPKGYVGWVYLYVTKGKPYIVDFRETSMMNQKYEVFKNKKNILGILKNKVLNGKVAFRFWFDEYEKISLELIDKSGYDEDKLKEYESENMSNDELQQKLCLDEIDIDNYLNSRDGYAWHIKKLEIFDEPKSLSDFYVTNKGLTYKYIKEYEERTHDYVSFRLKKAPQRSVWVYEEDKKTI